jgi:hypothetical protein
MTIVNLEHDSGRLTAAVSALDDLTIIRQPSICQAFNIVIGITRPTLLQVGTHWLVGEEVANNEFAVQLTLEVNKADDILTLLLLYIIIVVIIKSILVHKPGVSVPEQ